MQYLIDGHNLIPKIGLRLDSLDDENALIQRLQEFARLRRATVEVYFDRKAAGQPGRRQAGQVLAIFVQQGTSADAAIESRLSRLGRQARNWTVVSSDGRVQQGARAAHADVMSSEDFALLVSRGQGTRSTSKKETTLAPEEVEEWLKEFGEKRNRE
jgi:uncharacterized protein